MPNSEEKKFVPGAQSEQTPGANEPKLYSEEHVKELRDENAKWRTKSKDMETKLGEYQEIEQEKLKEDGKYKELLEAQTEKVKSLEALEVEVADYRSDFQSQIDDLKKKMDKDSESLFASLPESLSVKSRLQWAQKLTAKNNIQPSDPRPGAASQETADQVVAAFRKGDIRVKSEMLSRYSHENKSIYEQLLKA